VLGDIPQYAGHVRGTPRKNFVICAEKVDEHYFLSGVELRDDPDFLAGVVARVEGDRLNRLGRFEVASVALRIRRLLGEAIQVGDEGLGLGDGGTWIRR
jgi:NADPH-dependent 2,4-dienoyl-CoA reductase/sulfur reductase-like enzyme